MSFRFVVEADLVGKRLDVAVAERESALSRTRIRRLVEAGDVTVDGRAARPSQRLHIGETVEGTVPEPGPDRVEPEDIPLDVRFEDAHVIVIDKPPGMVVHPAAGHRSGTLVHALLFHCDELSGIGGVRRPGIVHRLDKDTSGLLVVAKNDAAHQSLAAQFKARTIGREYLAVVRGRPRAQRGSVDAPIGRHRSDPKRFSTRSPRSARHAVTHWEVVERLGELTLLRVRLETGRTHQIRVHLAAAGLPIAGDPVYGGERREVRALGFVRQALHATRLDFDHPHTGERMSFCSELPEDLARAIAGLR